MFSCLSSDKQVMLAVIYQAAFHCKYSTMQRHPSPMPAQATCKKRKTKALLFLRNEPAIRGGLSPNTLLFLVCPLSGMFIHSPVHKCPALWMQSFWAWTLFFSIHYFCNQIFLCVHLWPTSFMFLCNCWGRGDWKEGAFFPEGKMTHWTCVTLKLSYDCEKNKFLIKHHVKLYSNDIIRMEYVMQSKNILRLFCPFSSLF